MRDIPKIPTEEERAIKEAFLAGMAPGDILEPCYGVYTPFHSTTKDELLSHVYLFERDAWEDNSGTYRIEEVGLIMGADHKLYYGSSFGMLCRLVLASEAEERRRARRRAMKALSEDDLMRLGLINPDKYRDHP